MGFFLSAVGRVDRTEYYDFFSLFQAAVPFWLIRQPWVATGPRNLARSTFCLKSTIKPLRLHLKLPLLTFLLSVEELANSGLWGIEAFSSEIDYTNHDIIRDLAKRNHLVMTGGSDNHGTLKVGIRCCPQQARSFTRCCVSSSARYRVTPSWARCIVQAKRLTGSSSTGPALVCAKVMDCVKTCEGLDLE